MRDLKRLAQQAKNRLRGKTTDERNLKLLQGGEVEYKRVLLSEKENEIMYNKVKEILQREDVYNPIALLMDLRHYNSLPVDLREKYFFEIVDKFYFFKNQIEKENSLEKKAN